MKNAINYQEYIYDVAVDGGGTGTIVLSDNANKAKLPIGAVVMKAFGKVVTACTSTGSAQVSWGISGNANKFSGDIEVASLVDNYVKGWVNSDVYHAVTDATSGTIVVSVGTAALATGKIVIGFEYALPTVE